MAVNPENYFTGDGSTTSYNLTFEYIDETDVKVTLDGVLTTAYSFANATTILFDTAPGNDVEIRIYRDTNVDELKSTFFAGSSIRAQDLNQNFEQNNFAVQEIKAYTWDNETAAIHSDETWVSSDTQIATTAAMDARFQDEAAETITSGETWPDNDDTIATTAAIDNRIDTAITNDIGTDGTGITVTDDGDGTITLGLAANSIDFDRIKDADIITYAEQDAGSPAPSDTNLFTASAAARRFDTIVQTSTPSGSAWETGKTWLQNDADLTLSIWNGSAWTGVASGGTFTNQPKVVYVDASSGNDANDGHRISRPKATIKAAINQINADATYGDGSVVVVAPGVYQEAAPIQIQKKNVSIIGQALRSCIVHPTVATQGDQSAGNHALFELNSGSYIANLTLTGMQANTGTGNSVDATLPTNQGWNFAFYSGATITKSPYIQNCTNFSDSEIDNSNLNANTPAGGLAGDTDSAPTGGGLLVDGSVVDSASPLRSMVCDSYTHVGLNGPGILVTNNGYVQATSSYAFFNKYHIKTLNGGQANLAASTTDFGDQALVADGKSTTAIFTSNVDGAASDNAISFNINEPTAGSGWYGDTERPATNMLVEVNGVIYPILSATANTDSEGGAGWTVTISRPDPNNRSNNLGLNGAVSDDAAVSFYLRSMIASSGHTMEYVGSGTDYRALPENGGVPDETKQITESNNGKIWTAITDHNGKFKIGGNQTDDPIFEVDQQLGFVTIPEGSIAFNLLSDSTPQLGGNLDANTFDIILTGGSAADPSLRFTGDSDTGVFSPTADTVGVSTAGTERLRINSSGDLGIGTSSPSARLTVRQDGTGQNIQVWQSDLGVNDRNLTLLSPSSDSASEPFTFSTGNSLAVRIDASEAVRIDSSGNLGVGTTSPSSLLHIAGGTANDYSDGILLSKSGGNLYGIYPSTNNLEFRSVTGGNHIATFDYNGNVGIGTTSPGAKLQIDSGNAFDTLRLNNTAGGTAVDLGATSNGDLAIRTGAAESARIDSSGRLLVGTTTPSTPSNNTWTKLEISNQNLPCALDVTRNDQTVAVNSTIGLVRFLNNDDSGFQECASIQAVSDGDFANNDKPTRLVFSTTADGASTPTERMRISNDGSLSSVVPGGTTLYPHFACRAWVNFDGTGTVAINGSGNVSSITDNGTGSYTVNFTTAMPDANYAASAMASNTTDAANTNPAAAVDRTTTSCRVDSEASGGSQFDAALVDLIVFR